MVQIKREPFVKHPTKICCFDRQWYVTVDLEITTEVQILYISSWLTDEFQGDHEGLEAWLKVGELLNALNSGFGKYYSDQDVSRITFTSIWLSYISGRVRSVNPPCCQLSLHTRNHIALRQQTPRTTAKTPREYSHFSNNLKALFEEKYLNWLVEFKISILVSTRCVHRKQRNKTNTPRLYMN